MVCLVALHMLLAVDDLTRRGCYPRPIHHSPHLEVLNLTHYLDGYVPALIEVDGPWRALQRLLDGTRGPAIEWSNPRILWRELTRGWLRGVWDNDDYMTAFPLSFLLPAVVYKVTGGSVLAVGLAPQIFLALVLFSVYGIGRRVGGPWLGLVAAVIAGGYPGVYQLARGHHESLATGAMAAAVFCLLLYSRGFTRLGVCALAGVAAFLSTLVAESVSGTMLIGLIVIAPFCIEYLRLIGRSRRRAVEGLRGIAGLALFLAPPFLLFNWNRLIVFIGQSQDSFSDAGAFARVGSHVPESLHGIVVFLSYFFRISFFTLQPVMTLWLVVGAVLLWRAPRGERLSVLISVALPLVLLSIMPKKGAWYITPLCPGFALITALGLHGLRSPKRRRWAMGLAAACGLVMPLQHALLPRHVKDKLDLVNIWPHIKKTVWINGVAFGDEAYGPRLDHRAMELPVAVAARELVAHDLKNNPGAVGPRRVVALGGETRLQRGFRYLAELHHPDMFVIDLFNDFIPTDQRQRLLSRMTADKFDYMLFMERGLEARLKEMPEGHWDALKSRVDFVLMPRTIFLNDNWSFSDQKKWNTGLRRFAKALLERRWKRIDLSVGPIYQAVDKRP